MAFVKLFGSILDSTVWQTPLPTKVVWITLLAMADRDGMVESSIPGLAKRAGVEVEECEAALKTFKEPDPYSRSREFEGRRLKDLDGGGGWQLLNYEKYRRKMSPDERREYHRVKQAEYRSKKRVKGSGPLPGEGAFTRAIENGDEGLADRILEERNEQLETKRSRRGRRPKSVSGEGQSSVEGATFDAPADTASGGGDSSGARGEGTDSEGAVGGGIQAQEEKPAKVLSPEQEEFRRKFQESLAQGPDQ